jgi:hypothetical protein
VLDARERHEVENLFRLGQANFEALTSWTQPAIASSPLFLERDLSFRLRAEDHEVVLSVRLEGRFAPPFAERLRHFSYELGAVAGCWFDFPMSAARLGELANIVAGWRAAFPVRTWPVEFELDEQLISLGATLSPLSRPK